jgi:hypothetical protein
MTKRQISIEEFIREFRELSSDNEDEDLAYALFENYTIKRRLPGTIQCSNRNCKKEVFYAEAKGWIRLKGVQRLSDKKQWKDLHSEELFFCSSKCYIDEIKFSIELPC